jgi:hypothetical protein
MINTKQINCSSGSNNTQHSKLQTPKKSKKLAKLITVMIITVLFGSANYSYGQLTLLGITSSSSTPSASPTLIPVTVFSSLSPSDKALAKGGISLFTGAILVIDEPIDFNTGASILVRNGYNSGFPTGSWPGCRLMIADELTCTAGTWEGVKVLGQPLEQHFNISPNPSIFNSVPAYMGGVNPVHGFVDLQSGAIIENADHGVWSLDGGIVQSFVGPFAGKPQFVNCKEGLYVENSIQSPSAIRLNRCDFSWTDPNIHGYSDYYGFAHITISRSKDIRIGGCTIAGEYTMGRKYDTDVKGTGVLVIGPETTYSLSEGGNTFASGTGSGCITVKYDSDPTGTHQNLIAHFSTGVDVISSKDGAINNCFFIANITAARVVGDFVDFHDNIFRAKDDWMIQHFNPSPFMSSKLCIDLASIKAASIYRNTFNYHNFSFPNSPWPALAMVSINGFTGGEIKVIGNIFNGNVTNTLETKYALTGGGNLTNFEWRCNTFNDFETAVSYGGTGPALNPASGISAENTYTNLSGSWVINNTTARTTYFCNYWSSLRLNQIGLLNGGVGEENDCTIINCNTMTTKYKYSGSTASINDFETEKLQVYPNPSSGSITVDFGEGKVGSLTIYNAQGQQLQQASIKSGVRYEASQSLPTGLYFIEVFTDGDKRTSKLIIAK